MKKIIATTGVLMFLMALSAPLAFAQAAGAQPAAQDAAAQEAAAYKTWYDLNNAKDYPKALEAAQAYLEKYPNGQYAAYLKKWIPQARAAMLGAAVQAKNLAEIDRIGKDIMAADPDNLDFALFLASQLRTLDTNFQYTADTTQFTQTAIRLIDAGKTPAPKNPPVPFPKNDTLGYLHDTLATIAEHNKDTDKALAEYEQAAAIDPMNARYFFNVGRLHQTRYATAANEFQTKFTAEQRSAPEPAPEVKAALDKVNAEADGVINNWARFLGLPKNDYPPDVKQKVMTALTDLYKYRNNNSDAGLQKLIDDNKTSPTPVKMTPPVEKPQAAADQKPAGDGNGAKPGSTTPATAAKPAPTKKPRM
ncbi:MAG TPA: hypothetical protein VKA60_15945 [Blastocatellia bacterium]|nr:hypothetical protein [Blastocatellia bacterium]